MVLSCVLLGFLGFKSFINHPCFKLFRHLEWPLAWLKNIFINIYSNPSPLALLTR